MSDEIDIVIRLREIGSASGQVRKILQDGADEIERLRAELAEAYRQLRSEMGIEQ